MRKYETVFILRPELDEEKTNEAVEKFKSLVEGNGGEITSLDKWGKRRLAYEIGHVREGFYVVCKFRAEPAVASELDRVFKISDDVMRHIIVREDG
ncbi:MAG: 30S ribosomal protein S6 [Peptococcaceae bacterium]|nr:30S ribosomal protein S6 [Peptococcaceae bacterium]